MTHHQKVSIDQISGWGLTHLHVPWPPRSSSQVYTGLLEKWWLETPLICLQIMDQTTQFNLWWQAATKLAAPTSTSRVLFEDLALERVGKPEEGEEGGGGEGGQWHCFTRSLLTKSFSIRGERQRGVEERATAEVSAMVIRLCHFISQCPWSSYLCWSYVSSQVESHFQGLVVLGNASFRLTSTSLLSFVVVKVVINIHEGRVLTTNDMRKWEWELGQSQSFDRIHLSCYTLSPFSHVNRTRWTRICCKYIEAKNKKDVPYEGAES